MQKWDDFWFEWNERPWKTVSILGVIGCLLAAGILALPMGKTPFGRSTVMDLITLVPHEGGHMIVHGFVNVLSSIFGGEEGYAPGRFVQLSISIAGTLGQLLVFLGPAVFFFLKKSPTPLAFFILCFFLNFPGIGIYMQDCRTHTLEYVSYGDVDYENIAQMHDWTVIFGLLHIDYGKGEAFGKFLRYFGPAGMAGTALWLVWMYRRHPLTLPSAETQPAETAGAIAPPQEPRSPGGSETLLLIENDQKTSDAVASALRHKGYAVIQAGSLDEAVRKLSLRARKAELVIANFLDETIKGEDVVQRLRHDDPAVRAVLILGANERLLLHADLAGVAFIRRPLAENLLAMKIREVLEAPASTTFAAV